MRRCQGGFSGKHHPARRAAVAALEAAGPLAFVPERALAAATPSDIQFDIAAFLSSPPQTFGSGVKFQLPPVHTIFLTAALRRAPAKPDQAELDRVPGGGSLPKLQFTIFVPTAQFFATLRTSQASLDLQNLFGVDPRANGLERFITATRRQNFLIPPRRHRAFPLVEFT